MRSGLFMVLPLRRRAESRQECHLWRGDGGPWTLRRHQDLGAKKSYLGPVRIMMAARSFSTSFGIPVGVWRWVALGFLCLALVAAGLAVATPQLSGWMGALLVAAIGAVAGRCF